MQGLKLVAFVSLFLGGGSLSAQAQTFEGLQGHSIVIDYVEDIAPINGNPIMNRWLDTVYVSPVGRIYLRQRFSSRFGQGGSQSTTDRYDTVGDRDGIGQGNRTNFRWDGEGFTRSWTHGPVHLTQTIAISGNSCRSGIVRSGFGGTVSVRADRCRIVAGNLLK